MPAYTFGPRDYLLFMPCVATDRHRGRLHECPLCGDRVWSCWGHADTHWQGHGRGQGSITCPDCGEEVGQVFEPPRLRVPRSVLACGEINVGDQVWWRVPGSAFPGRECFTVVALDGDDVLLLPPETPDEPICHLCWAGSLWPALHPYVDNQPAEFRLDGWRDPVWAGSPSQQYSRALGRL